MTETDPRVTYAKENLAPDQAPRTKEAHLLIEELKRQIRQIEQAPATLHKVAQEIATICNDILKESDVSTSDTELVDTYILRADIDRMIEAKSPETMGIPKYTGGTSEEAKSFFIRHYGEKYNRPSFEVIFTPDLFTIDDKLLRALRYAYGGAKNLPLGSREALTNATIVGRFGSNIDRVRANIAIAHRYSREVLNYG
jgi:hypothetical protein